MITKYLKDDITKTTCQAIAHGVNCQGIMGSGVAKALYTAFPIVKESYLKYYTVKKCLMETNYFLGKIDHVFINSELIIYNCFTQDFYGNDGKRYINYAAVVNCLQQIIQDYEDGVFEGPIAIPKIGCGLAGGNWQFMEQLINDTVSDKLEIWVYHLD